MLYRCVLVVDWLTPGLMGEWLVRAGSGRAGSGRAGRAAACARGRFAK